LDYNSTGPLSKSVKAFLNEGLDFFNPSSTHPLGKSAHHAVSEVDEFLFSFFEMSKDEYNLFFHSGATESISTFFKGPLLHFKDDYALFTSKLDHAAVKENSNVAQEFGAHTDSIENAQSFKKYNLANITAVNNETGRVADAALIRELKDKGVYVHIDASQLPFRISDWKSRFAGADYYTFSGHKFGAMKGSGFSFVKKDAPFFPLLSGGGQQSSMRSGTENVPAVVSIKKALEEYSSIEVESVAKARDQFEQNLSLEFKNKIRFIDSDIERSSNTSLLFFEGLKSDFAQLLFSQKGVIVGLGPACSKGLMKPSEVLQALGLSELETKQTIRVSFPIDFDIQEIDKLIKIFVETLKTVS
jgi:cysteine desulfurase